LYAGFSIYLFVQKYHNNEIWFYVLLLVFVMSNCKKRNDFFYSNVLVYRTKISHKNVIQDTEHRFEKNVTYDKLGKFPGTLMSISIVTTIWHSPQSGRIWTTYNIFGTNLIDTSVNANHTSIIGSTQSSVITSMAKQGKNAHLYDLLPGL
jgi:hypothetical protein